MCHRPGLSRADVVFALLIVVVVVGLFLVGVARLREAAEAVGCQNNLKQLGLATHNYHDVFCRLPPLVDQGEGAPTGCGMPSLFAHLIPAMEATTLVFRTERPPEYYLAHSSVRITYPHKDEMYTQHGGIGNHVLRVFVDPADRTASKLRDVPITLPSGTTGYYATGSYAANGMLPWGYNFLQRPSPGGAANTILFGERPQVCQTAAGETVYNLWGLGVYSPHMPAFATLTPSKPPGLWDTGQVAPGEPLTKEGAADRAIRIRIGRRDAQPIMPDFVKPVQFVRVGQPCDPRLPGTPHRGGMQVAMGDGSVRVFAHTTSAVVFWAACDPKAQQVLAGE